MAPAPLRKDAARNWHKIVEVGRRLADDGARIQLNDVARIASVGVATVYRHFPTPEALVETVATPGLQSLAQQAERALTGDDPWTGLRDFLHAAISAQTTDAAVAAVLAAPQHVLSSTTELMQQLTRLFGELLGRAQAAGTADPALTPADMAPLMCGVAFAAKVRPATGAAGRAANARRYLDVLLEGVRTKG
ncbi:TetR/AcrR family transcriptional regulator [Streptomyces sp. NPDC047000]|uniref:TetR/AcrR family transcriptional regulator n=1 Tax=Streptomyces sp. NPDC047000 TaxID=3155474 RepID=UPI0033ECEEBA